MPLRRHDLLLAMGEDASVFKGARHAHQEVAAQLGAILLIVDGGLAQLAVGAVGGVRE